LPWWVREGCPWGKGGGGGGGREGGGRGRGGENSEDNLERKNCTPIS
jgi:hypothetical protein